MKVIETATELQQELAGKRVGAVLTMGALHSGHVALMQTCRKLIGEDGILVVSIFVNPTQFNDRADLAKYPRTPQSDLERCKAAGVDIVFMPSESEIYPADAQVPQFSAGALGRILEGESRPGHFDAVVTVVHRLLDLLHPQVTCFGEKDYQQLVAVRQLVQAQDIPCEVVGVPTVRADSGLALSSRNSRLTDAGKVAATALYRALRAVVTEVTAGVPASTAIESAKFGLSQVPNIELDYLVVTNAMLELNSEPQPGQNWSGRVLIAAKVEGVRLIDNLPIEVTG